MPDPLYSGGRWLQVPAHVLHSGEMIWLSGLLGKVSALSWELHRKPAVSYWTQSPYTGEQIENLLLSSSAHSGGTIKGDNCCLASNWRTMNIFFLSFSTQVVSGAIHYRDVVNPSYPGSWSPTEPQAVAFCGMSAVADITAKLSTPLYYQRSWR